MNGPSGPAVHRDRVPVPGDAPADFPREVFVSEEFGRSTPMYVRCLPESFYRGGRIASRAEKKPNPPRAENGWRTLTIISAATVVSRRISA